MVIFWLFVHLVAACASRNGVTAHRPKEVLVSFPNQAVLANWQDALLSDDRIGCFSKRVDIGVLADCSVQKITKKGINRIGIFKIQIVSGVFDRLQFC